MNILKAFFGSKEKSSNSNASKETENLDVEKQLNKIKALSDPSQKESEIEKLNSRNRGNHDILTEAGFIFSKNNKYEKALKYYNEFLKTFLEKDDQIIGYYQLGVVYTKAKKFEEAIAAHSKAIEIDKYAFMSYNGLGDVYFEMKDYKKARDCYLRFYSHDDVKNDLVANRLAGIEYELGNIKAAIKYQNDAIRINPEKSEWHYNLANFYEKNGDYELLKKTLLFACQKFPDNFLLLSKYVEIRMMYKEGYDLEQTKEYAEKAFELNSKDIIIRIFYARLIIDSIENKRLLDAQFIASKENIKNLEDAIKIHEETLTMNFPDLLRDGIMESCGKAARMLGWSEDKISMFVVEAAHRKMLGAAYLKILSGEIK